MNKGKLRIILIALAAIVLAVIIYFVFSYKNKGNSVVYLSTGEVYVGKLSCFPRLVLDNAYQLQVVKDNADPSKNNFQLNPIKDALWSPKYLYLNRDQVIFYGPLEDNSKISQTLASQEK